MHIMATSGSVAAGQAAVEDIALVPLSTISPVNEVVALEGQLQLAGPATDTTEETPQSITKIGLCSLLAQHASR